MDRIRRLFVEAYLQHIGLDILVSFADVLRLVALEFGFIQLILQVAQFLKHVKFIIPLRRFSHADIFCDFFS